MQDQRVNVFEGLEPVVATNRLGNSPDVAAIFAHSQAVSMKRIADALEQIASGMNPDKPVNMYGEGLFEAIQNSIERGLRGIGTYDTARAPTYR